MSTAPVSRIVHYRGRSDTGTVDGTPTFIAAEDTSFGVTVGTAFRIRISVENTGTAADTITAPDTTRGIARCGGSQFAYASLANIINGADAGSSADAANVTVQRLTSGTGSFATGTAGYDENETLSCNVTNGNFTEVECGVVLTGGVSTPGAGGGESWAFQLGGLTNASAQTPTFTTPDTNGSDFSHGNQLGATSQKVADSASISHTTLASAAAGDLVVVVVTCDNNGTGDGDNSEISSVSIGGNAATKAVEYTNGQGAAQGGVTVSIWYLQLAGTLATSSTITANFTTATTSGDANVIQARAFTVAGGKTVSVEATNGAATDAATQPASLDATTSSRECLRVCAHSIEGGGSTQANSANLVLASNRTWSVWFSGGFMFRQTGNGVTDCCSQVEANISTGTGAASRAAALASAGDWASAYVAFKADTPAAFEPKPLDRAGADATWSRIPIGY